jgi:hypothetical protein
VPEGRIGRKRKVCGPAGPLFFSSFSFPPFSRCSVKGWREQKILLLDSRRNRARGKERVRPKTTTWCYCATVTGHTGVCLLRQFEPVFYIERSCPMSLWNSRGFLSIAAVHYLLLHHQSDFVCLVSECNSREREFGVSAGSAQGLRRSSAAAKTE